MNTYCGSGGLSTLIRMSFLLSSLAAVITGRASVIVPLIKNNTNDCAGDSCTQKSGKTEAKMHSWLPLNTP